MRSLGRMNDTSAYRRPSESMQKQCAGEGGMKILFIAPLPPPLTGHSLAASVLLRDVERSHQVEVVNLSIGSSNVGAISPRRILEVVKVLVLVWRKQHTVDAIYFTTSESVAGNLKDLLIYLLSASRLSCMYIHVHGGSLKKKLFDPHPILRWCNEFAIRRLAGVIISGPAHEEIFSPMIDGERIHLVPNFAQDELFVEEQRIAEKFGTGRQLRFLYLSGMRAAKGYRELTSAYFLLDASTRREVCLDFAGEFDSEAERIAFLKDIAGFPGLRYHGFVDDETKRSLFAHANVFCLPTTMSEGQPISILEAYASGCVVVTTGQDGIRDIFTDGINGFEIECHSSNSIASVIRRICDIREELEPIARRNRQIAAGRYRTQQFTAAVTKILRGHLMQKTVPAFAEITEASSKSSESGSGALSTSTQEKVLNRTELTMGIVTRLGRRIRNAIMHPFLVRRMRKLGITYFPPNYIYHGMLTESGIVADVGCGHEAEFSRHMIAEHDVRAFGVDPTRKHAPFLLEVERTSEGRFTYLPLAVTRENGVLTFHESNENESGSVLASHTNMLHDHTNDYEVESINLLELTRRLGGGRVDFVKLDLEGAEYDLLANVSDADLAPFSQLFVEFHHHCTAHTMQETLVLVERIASKGFSVFTLDQHNYLFYRPKLGESSS
jgi:FkbM family methyltransferase